MKRVLLISSVGILIVSGFLFTRQTLATGFSAKNILKSVTILGTGVVKNDSMKMVLVQETEGDGVHDQQIDLPPISGNDGMVYVVKFYPDSLGQSGTGAFVRADGTDKIENTNNDYYFGGIYYSRDALILVADASNNSWWIVGSH